MLYEVIIYYNSKMGSYSEQQPYNNILIPSIVLENLACSNDKRLVLNPNFSYKNVIIKPKRKEVSQIIKVTEKDSSVLPNNKIGNTLETYFT